MKKYALGAALGFLVVTPAISQTYKDSFGTVVQGVAPLVGCATTGFCLGPVSASNPLPVAGTFSAGGFTPTSVGTPIAATAAGATGTLPAGSVVVATNVGTTNGAYCALGSASSTSQQYIGPNGGWFAFTIPAGANQMTCVTSTSTTTINLVGGSGLATGAVGGSGGGGGGSSIANWAAGTLGAMANYGASPGAVLVPGVNAFVTNSPAVTQSGSWTDRVVGNAGGIFDGATAASVPANALYMGMSVAGTLTGLTGSANGLKVDGSAVTQPVSAASLPLPTGAATAANQITGSNYGNQANWVSGAGNVATATQTTIIAAPGSNKLYITGLQCFRSDAGTTLAYVTLNDTATTIEALPPNSGTNVVFSTPLVLAATTAFKFTPSAALATVYCNAQGFNAP